MQRKKKLRVLAALCYESKPTIFHWEGSLVPCVVVNTHAMTPTIDLSTSSYSLRLGERKLGDDLMRYSNPNPTTVEPATSSLF